jgi:hypothetical protein
MVRVNALVALTVIISSVGVFGYDQANNFQFPLLKWQVGCNDYWSTCNTIDGSHHLGEDASATAGTPVFSPANGQVKEVGEHTRYGGTVLIECYTGSENVTLIIGHMNTTTLVASPGDIHKGDLIGYVGTWDQNGHWPEHSHLGIHKGQYNDGTSCDGGWTYAGYTNGTNGCTYDDWYSPRDFIANQNIIYCRTALGSSDVGTPQASPFGDRYCVESDAHWFKACHGEPGQGDFYVQYYLSPSYQDKSAIVFDALNGGIQPKWIHSESFDIWFNGGEKNDANRIALGMPITNSYWTGTVWRQDFQSGYIANGVIHPYGDDGAVSAPGWTEDDNWNYQISYLISEEYERNGARTKVGKATNKVQQIGNVYVQQFDDGQFLTPTTITYNSDPNAPSVERAYIGPLSVVNGINVASGSYFIGQTVTASFDIKNFSNGTLFIDALAIRGTGPGGSSDIQDFEFDTKVGSIASGKTYLYQGNLTFTKSGLYTFSAKVKVDGIWYPLPSVLEKTNTFSANIAPRIAQWKASPAPLTNCDLFDANNNFWYETDFDDQNWVNVTLPNGGWCCDRYYRTTYYHSANDASVKFDLHSDDGLWLYINGQFFDHWGGECHAPGCVNGSGCAINDTFSPVDVTSYLLPGANLIAVHVSNGPGGSNFNFSYQVSPKPPDCALTLAGDRLISCPAGDRGYEVTLRNENNEPVIGYSNVWLDFSSCIGITHCSSISTWPKVYPSAPSDANGKLYFFPKIGGNCPGTVALTSACGIIKQLNIVRSYDLDGDLTVEYGDFVNVSENDYNGDNVVDWMDYIEEFFPHVFHSCTPAPPVNFYARLSSDPPSGQLKAGETAEIRLRIGNNNSLACFLDSVKFSYSGFNIAYGNWTEFEVKKNLWNLDPGQTGEVAVPFTVPNGFHGCIQAYFWTSCSGTTSYRVQLNLDSKPGSIAETKTHTCETVIGDAFGYPIRIQKVEILPPGWSASVSDTMFYSEDTLALTITPSLTAAYGDKGSVTAIGYDSLNKAVGSVTCEMEITFLRGDVNGDSNITLSDVIYLVNHIFNKPNPGRPGCVGADQCWPIVPKDRADLNCDGLTTLSDVICLVRKIFGQPKPPSCCYQ